MMFAKRHYETIALILGKENAPLELTKAFAEMFRQDNPSFKNEKFLEAVNTGKHIRSSIKARI